MDELSWARLFAILGGLFFLLAGLFLILSRFDIPWSEIPGNLVIRRDNFTCVFPLALSLGLSLLLTVILNLVIRLIQR